MNYRLNTMILGQVGMIKYGIGFSLESWINMSQKLQLKSDFTLETAIQRARQSEMVKSQATDQNFRASKDVDEVQSKKTPVSSRWRKKKGKKKDSSQKQTQKKGGRCSLHHTKPEQCFAKDKKSLKCQKAGHFAAVCWSKSVSEVNNSSGGGATNGSSVDR